MKNIGSYIAYYAAFVFWFLFSLLPLRVLYIFGDVLYLLVAHVVKYRHKLIMKNLRESFPEKSDVELLKIEKGFYHSFCDYLMETVKLMTMSKKQLTRRLVFTGLDEFNDILRSGQSVGVFLGHIFNWEWITSLPYWVPEGVQCTEIYHPLENRRMDKLFKDVREKQNALCIPMAESLRKIIGFGRQNKAIVVGYIADQAPFWNNIHHWLTFLNHDTPVLTGAERIIKHTGQAAFYCDVRRVRRGYYQCEMKLIARDTKTIPDFEITDRYFEMLQQTITEQPENYLWSHNRWKRSHEEFNIRYNKETGRVDLRTDLEEIKREKGLK